MTSSFDDAPVKETKRNTYIDEQYLDQFPMNDSFEMEELFICVENIEPSAVLYHNNPDMTADRRCRIVNWLLEVKS